MLSEKLDIVSGDEMNLESEGQSASKESSNTSSESECDSKTSARKETYLYCKTCTNQPAMCPGECFKRYHTLKNFEEF
jgi:hypothetical protein